MEHHMNETERPGSPLPFAGCENVRELGGYRTQDGRKVKHGVFFRGPALCDIRLPEDRALFASLGIRTVLDLRSESERRNAPDPVLEGVEYISRSALRDARGGTWISTLKQYLPAGNRPCPKCFVKWTAAMRICPFRTAPMWSCSGFFQNKGPRLFSLQRGKRPNRYRCGTDSACAGSGPGNGHSGLSGHQHLPPEIAPSGGTAAEMFLFAGTREGAGGNSRRAAPEYGTGAGCHCAKNTRVLKIISLPNAA